MPAKILVRLVVVMVLACGGCAGRDENAKIPPLALTLWSPVAAPMAVVVAVHGRNGDHSVFAVPAALWARRGILTYAYDQRPLMAASGRLGVAALVDDLEGVVALIHEQYPDTPLFVLGESMGSGIIILASARPHPVPVAGIILSSPPIWPDAVSASSAQAMLAVTGDVFHSPLLQSWSGLVALMEAAPEQAPALAGRPVLVLYGERDSLIPAAGVDRLMLRLGSGARLEVFPDEGHRVVRSPAASEVVADWIAATAAR